MALRVDNVDLGRDRALVERYQSGDDTAFEDLYTRYFSRLHRYCTRRVHDIDTAEEIAQEAFVRALQALPRLDGERRFYPWMTVIASRLCVDHHRDRQRTHPSDTVDLGSVDADVAHVFTAVDHSHLAEALARINPRHRRVLELREREGLPYEAIAERMGVTLGAVEALLHRARKALRREFIAVSEDGGRLASIPVLGWMFDRIGRVRHKMPALSDAANSLALGFASAAMVIAPVTGFGGFGSDPATSASTEATNGAGQGAGHGFDVARSLGAGSAHRPGDLYGGPQNRLEPTTPESRAVAQVRSHNVGIDSEGRDKAGSSEEEADAGPVKVGVSPSQIADDVVEEATDFLENQ